MHHSEGVKISSYGGRPRAPATKLIVLYDLPNYPPPEPNPVHFVDEQEDGQIDKPDRNSDFRQNLIRRGAGRSGGFVRHHCFRFWKNKTASIPS